MKIHTKKAAPPSAEASEPGAGQAPQQKSKAKDLRVNEKKWSKGLMDGGWTVLPNVLFYRQKALGLDAIDINIILHLASYWWDPEGKPHPSKATIATAMQLDPRTIQRRIARMEAANFIQREERRIPGQGSKTNIYHFDGLIDAAKPYAAELVAERKKNEQAAKSRAGRMKPKREVAR